MKNLTQLTLISLSLLLISCGQSYNSDNQAIISKQGLIGGEVLKEGVYDSVVFINRSCTATKISPKHIILAAHCFFIGETYNVRQIFHSGSKLTLHNINGIKSEYTVKMPYAHHSYLKELKLKIKEDKWTAFATLHSSDVGIVELNEEIQGATIAEIDYSELIIDSKDETIEVDIVGTGCEQDVISKMSHDKRRFKIGHTEIIHNSYVDEDDYKMADYSNNHKYNFLTKGPNFSDKMPGTCPGDSGGPVFMNRKLVGINSYGIYNDRSSIPFANVQAKLSEVKEWIQDILNK